MACLACLPFIQLTGVIGARLKQRASGGSACGLACRMWSPFHRGQVYAVELKTEGGRATHAQLQVIEDTLKSATASIVRSPYIRLSDP